MLKGEIPYLMSEELLFAQAFPLPAAAINMRTSLKVPANPWTAPTSPKPN